MRTTSRGRQMTPERAPPPRSMADESLRPVDAREHSARHHRAGGAVRLDFGIQKAELRGSDSNRRPLGYEFNPLRPRSSLLVPDRARLYSSPPSLVPFRPFWSPIVPARL